MFNSRESFETFLESDKLDDLLSAAKQRTAKLAGLDAEKEPFGVELDRLQDEVAEVQGKSAEAGGDLVALLEEREAARQDKVATVRAIVHTASRLVD